MLGGRDVIPTFDIVVPTIGRPELQTLLASLAAQAGPAPANVHVIYDHDRRGPAATRNVGWRRSTSEWVVFLDDDVHLPPGWADALADDLSRLGAGAWIGGIAGRVDVPLPAGRRPTDRERDTAQLATAKWITADIAYRRDVLAAVEGFDEGFPIAYREDADLGLRVQGAGYRIESGTRCVVHPVRHEPAWASVRRQRGNASDARMRRKHGPDWRTRVSAPSGRLPLHVASCACALGAVSAATLGRRGIAALFAASWCALTGEFAYRRIAPGPRTPVEVAAMIGTSVVIPPVAIWHRLRGELTERFGRIPRVVLFDRDGTLIVDHPYNGKPELVEPVAGAKASLDRLRSRGIALAVVSNQSGIARGTLTHAEVRAVNARVEQMLGPFRGWWYCPHDDHDACTCRKPAPGMLRAALERLGVSPRQCVMVGDTGADVDAARAIGVRSILVPNGVTRAEEVAGARRVAPSLNAAVDMLIGAEA
jgi:HAD superfamily hydrolase (TIGR01662 family)